SLLHLQASSASQDDVKAALTNAMGRVAAVAPAHRRLYTSHDLKSVLLNQYLDALLEDLRRSAEGNRMSRLTLQAETVEIDPDRAVAIGIIVNELVMNAVKYAYPDGAGPIHVDLRTLGEDIVLSIADDGVGLNGKSDPPLDRHGPADRLRHGHKARGERRARSRSRRYPDRGTICPAQDPDRQIGRQRRREIAVRRPFAAPAPPCYRRAHDLARLVRFRHHARSAAARLRLRHIPNGRKRRRSDPVLGRAGNARHYPAGRLSHLLAARAHRALRHLHGHGRQGLQGGDGRLRCAGGRPRGHLDQQAHPRPLRGTPWARPLP